MEMLKLVSTLRCRVLVNNYSIISFNYTLLFALCLGVAGCRNPDDVIKEWGADCLRLFEMFLGPLDQVKPWQTKGITHTGVTITLQIKL